MRGDKKAKGHSLLPDDAQPCAWMTAGVLTYKLCDRALDCDHCPLDAALRGRPTALSERRPVRRAAWAFPDDRRYGACHLWAQARGARVVRLGVDSFAAELLATASAVRLPDLGSSLGQAELIALVDAHAGQLPLRAPLAGAVAAVNHALLAEPELLLADPYGEGWLCELVRADDDAAAVLAGLWSGADLRRQARLEMKRFRRQIAMQLLIGTQSVGASMADGGESVTDLRQMLGHDKYKALVLDALSGAPPGDIDTA